MKTQTETPAAPAILELSLSTSTVGIARAAASAPGKKIFIRGATFSEFAETVAPLDNPTRPCGALGVLILCTPQGAYKARELWCYMHQDLSEKGLSIFRRLHAEQKTGPIVLADLSDTKVGELLRSPFSQCLVELTGPLPSTPDDWALRGATPTVRWRNAAFVAKTLYFALQMQQPQAVPPWITVEAEDREPRRPNTTRAQKRG